ncbi:TRAP transporter small permease subunit (plasmid) [Thioclava sp. 'Guangxiensis']|uniref:TRAP transporter small permease n=1 Tax=Thioclava sp. 'Guangxiensis' TaxID=3149044 RepID=UPI0032C4116F
MGPIRTVILRTSAVLDRLASVVTCIALVLLVGIVLLQVVARYLFDQPPSWTEEAARYAMIWAGLIGASMAFKRRFDPALMNSVKGGPLWLQTGAELLRSIVVVIYLGPILLYCFVGPNLNLARGFLLRHSKTMAEALPFTTFWVAIAVPLMILMVFVHLVARHMGDRPPADSDAIEE